VGPGSRDNASKSRGAKPMDLPVQLLVKFEMTFNPKAAKCTRPDYAAIDSAPRRQGDRMTAGFHRRARKRGALAGRGASAAGGRSRWLDQLWGKCQSRGRIVSD
jgi:hypothetical protein